MGFNVGSGTTMTFGKESRYGTKATGKTLINLTSESLKANVEKANEGSLLASKTASTKDIMAVNVDGSVSFILRPEFAGLLFAMATGGTDKVTAGTPEPYKKHTFTLAEPNADLPSFTITVDRKASTKAYTGCTVSALTLDCAANDYVKGTMDIKGHKEETDTIGSVTPFTMPSYRCTSASFALGVKQYCITNASFKLDNLLEDAPKTYCSGLYSDQPQHGMRTVTIDFDIPYSQDIETLKDTYLYTEDTAKVELKFTARDTNNTVTITMPHVSIGDITANVSGAGIITASVSGEALSEGNEEPLTIVLQDKQPTAYTA